MSLKLTSLRLHPRHFWLSVTATGLALFILLPGLRSFGEDAAPKDLVILLHGLGRTSASMKKMAIYLTQKGFSVHNIDYPSRTSSIPDITDTILLPVIQQADSATAIYFVTHSMGGIVVRDFLQRHPNAQIKRVVMLAPPNGGSEVADHLAKIWPINAIMGKNLELLQTDSTSFVNRLRAPEVEVGIIAGNRSLNWLNSIMIKGADDGKVAVAKTKLPGMTDFLILPVTHTFMMSNKEVMRQTYTFLRQGRFDHSSF